MFNLEQRMGRMNQLAQQIQAKELAFTDTHKQAAIVKAEIEQTIFKLVMDKVTIKVIFFSLLYFWLKIEAMVHNISDQQFVMTFYTRVCNLSHRYGSTAPSFGFFSVYFIRFFLFSKHVMVTDMFFRKIY